MSKLGGLMSRTGTVAVLVVGTVVAISIPKTARAYNALAMGGGPVLSPDIQPLFWGNWTSDHNQDNDPNLISSFVTAFAGYISGVGAPQGQEPVVKQYGVWGARVLPSVSIGVGSDTHIRNAGVAQRIALLQSTGQLPPSTPNRVFVVFLKGFTYDFSDWSGWASGDCAYHANSGGTYYAVVPWEYLGSPDNGGNCTVQTATSHELMESMTDPYPWNGWVTTPSTFFHNEGADQCGTGTSLSFGFVSSFSDNASSTCASFSRRTTSPLALTRASPHVLAGC
jgi:hypothetical protein